MRSVEGRGEVINGRNCLTCNLHFQSCIPIRHNSAPIRTSRSYRDDVLRQRTPRLRVLAQAVGLAHHESVVLEPLSVSPDSCPARSTEEAQARSLQEPHGL